MPNQKSLPRREAGFAHIALILLIVTIIAAGAFIFFLTSKNGHSPISRVTQNTGSQNTNCKDEKIVFDTTPLAINDIDHITPQGRTEGEHVTPTDHQYWTPVGMTHGTASQIGRSSTNPDRYKIVAMADGTITQVEQFQNGDYRLNIEHTCDVFSILIHLDKISDRLMQEANFRVNDPTHQHAQINVDVKKGEQIGSVNAHTFDFSLHDRSVVLGYVNPENYAAEDWRVHTIDPFDYFTPEIRSQLIAKTLGNPQPPGGTIDYDAAGKLVGNWKKEGVQSFNDFEEAPPGEFNSVNNLSIVYDHLDPSIIRVSIGDYFGEEKQFNVAANSPDPATVGVGQQTKYELVEYRYIEADTGNPWDQLTYYPNVGVKNEGPPVGVALFQLTDEETLKVEFFPGKSPSEATTFTSGAKTYNR